MIQPDRRKSSPLVFPDPPSCLDLLSSATLLWFDKPILLTLPPLGLIEESYQLITYLRAQSTGWASQFLSAFMRWQAFKERCSEVTTVLEPVNASKTLFLVYAATEGVVRQNITFLRDRQLTPADISPVDPDAMLAEAMRHVMTEIWSEYQGDMDRISGYVEDRFQSPDRFMELASGSYLSRVLPIFQPAPETESPSLLVTNPRLLPLMTPGTAEEDDSTAPLVSDVIAWEVFRQLVGARLDPLTEKTIEVVAEIRQSRTGELEALRVQCERLSLKIEPSNDINQLSDQVERLVRIEASEEIAALFKLNQTALRGFFTDLVRDEKTWGATMATIGGLATGNAHFTLGGALASIAFVGAKTTAATVDAARHKRNSPYRILYRMSQSID